MNFNLERNEMKCIRIKDLVWIIKSQIDRSFSLVIYPKSNHLLSCTVKFEIGVKTQIQKLTSILYKEKVIKFNPNSKRHKLNLGSIDMFTTDDNYHVKELGDTFIQIFFDMKISDIQRKRN